MSKKAEKQAAAAVQIPKQSISKHIRKYWQYYAMMLIPILYYIIVSGYGPRRHR